ncbi:hypothetical protein HAX54_034948 [Datura stramonium]|uniref:Uncharacterized protein n=1 Tax=Datura stramonium TaxID=4076 RepID=A0ABS8VEQ8_DATST|nr:hypothetical protein [Datura stramonium]
MSNKLSFVSSKVVARTWNLYKSEGISGIRMTSKFMKHRVPDGPSLDPSSNQERNLSLCKMVVSYDGLSDDIPKGNTDGSSSSSDNSNSDERSGNEATSSPSGDTETIRGDLIKGKSPARGHFKCSIAKEVRIIDSELLEYPDIEGKYKFYCLG